MQRKDALGQKRGDGSQSTQRSSTMRMALTSGTGGFVDANRSKSPIESPSFLDFHLNNDIHVQMSKFNELSHSLTALS